MAKFRSIKIAALNIAMHQPHSQQRYMSLFRDAKRLRVLVELGSLHAAILGSLNGPKEFVSGAVLTGEVYRFVKLDASEPWFNLNTSDVASEGDMGGIQIPPHLLPHLQRIEFVFHPDKHELWFVSQDRKDRIGSLAAATFFQNLFDRVHDDGKCAKVEVTPLPDKESLEIMLSLPQLDRLYLSLKRPNPDDAAGYEARWNARLSRMNVQRLETELVASTGASIQLDEDMRQQAIAASRNGSVRVLGRDSSGQKIDESTVARPMILTQSVNSEIETSADVLLRTSRDN